MKLTCCLYVFLIFLNSATAQEKITGVYFGSFITSKNALSLTSKDTIITGSFFTDQYEELPFQGFFSKNNLRGYFARNGITKVVSGTLRNDSLSINLFSEEGDKIIQNGVMVRVSSNPKFNVSGLFAKEAMERDTMLIHKWLIVKKVNSNGENILKDSYYYEYEKNGNLLITGPAIDRMIGNTSKNIQIPTYSWQTKNGKMISSRNATILQYPDSGEQIHQYRASEDTLILINSKSTEYLIRK